MVSIRISNPGISHLLAALLRSTIAYGLVFAYLQAKEERLTFPCRDVRYLVNRPEKLSEE